jgi:hypothetical protein
MAGGLLNLISGKTNNQDHVLNGNPKKSFFKAKYVKYTNFGLEKYRMDQTGQQDMQLSQKTLYTFKIKRYADLLIDSYLVITLPTIWSPIYKSDTNYIPYEFQWIKNIGTQIIDEVEITIGGLTIEKFSGAYLQNMVERDFDADKKELFNRMTGNIPELNDPANYANRNNNYPNAWTYDICNNSIEPSINGYQLFIPINTWFNLLPNMAIPLVCLQYQELHINFTLRPIKELYTIKKVDSINNFEDIPRIHPSQMSTVYDLYGFHRFIQEPPVQDISSTYNYANKTKKHFFDIHMLTTQCFLSDEERTLFANNPQTYLIKEIKEYTNSKMNKSGKFKLESNGLVCNWMWYLQRNDVKERNEWSNYSNWPYENKIPNNLNRLTKTLGNLSLPVVDSSYIYYNTTTYSTQDTSKNIFITGYHPDQYQQKNFKNILQDFGITCDGKYREQTRPVGVYDKIEKYLKTPGNAKDGLYFYNFSLTSDPFKYQPSGVFNTNKFRTIEFEYNNYSNPPIDFSGAQFKTICDPNTGAIIGVEKDPTNIYQYNYDLHIFEERYNVLVFQSGMAQKLYE